MLSHSTTGGNELAIVVAMHVSSTVTSELAFESGWLLQSVSKVWQFIQGVVLLMV